MNPRSRLGAKLREVRSVAEEERPRNGGRFADELLGTRTSTSSRGQERLDCASSLLVG